MKIGDRCFVHGYIDEIRKDTVIVRNDGGYFGTILSEVTPSAQPEIIRCKDCKWCEDADGLMCKNTASWVVATDYDFGCVLAERRQDG